MSANPEQKVPASIIKYQEWKKELAARMEAETYRVFSIDSTRLRTRTNCGYIYLFSKCLIY
jgi:hypothetical protein